MKNRLRSAVVGLAVGDALGVPVEFRPRKERRADPVLGMREYGTHNQPIGTWSDDTSLTLCTMDAMSKHGCQFDKVAERFTDWLYRNQWTPHGIVFDIGGTTRSSIDKVARGMSHLNSGEKYIESNGNGSLMRTLPLAFSVRNMSLEERWKNVSELSSITHAHPISRLACFYYVEFILHILEGIDPLKAYIATRGSVDTIMNSEKLMECEEPFKRLLVPSLSIITLTEEDISSGGYVMDTLEASIYCILTTSSYPEAVLKAVNLGGDTDTTGAVTGGLAGLIYGEGNIPNEWREQLVGRHTIEQLCSNFSNSIA